MNELEEISQRVRPLKIMWVVMILGVLTVTAVVLVLVTRRTVAPVPALRGGLGIYIAIGLVLGLAAAQFVRRLIDKTPAYATRGEVARRWQAGWVVGQTIKEGVGLAGLALALFVGSTAWAMAFGVASALSMIMTPPWERDLHRRLQGTRGDPERAD